MKKKGGKQKKKGFALTSKQKSTSEVLTTVTASSFSSDIQLTHHQGQHLLSHVRINPWPLQITFCWIPLATCYGSGAGRVQL